MIWKKKKRRYYFDLLFFFHELQVIQCLSAITGYNQPYPYGVNPFFVFSINMNNQDLAKIINPHFEWIINHTRGTTNFRLLGNVVSKSTTVNVSGIDMPPEITISVFIVEKIRLMLQIQIITFMAGYV